MVAPGHSSLTALSLSLSRRQRHLLYVCGDQPVPSTAVCVSPPLTSHSHTHTQKEPGIKGSFVTFSSDVTRFVLVSALFGQRDAFPLTHLSVLV